MSISLSKWFKSFLRFAKNYSRSRIQTNFLSKIFYQRYAITFRWSMRNSPTVSLDVFPWLYKSPQGRSKDQETEMFKGWNVVIINRSNSRKRSPWACLVFEFRTEWSRSTGFHMSQAVSISPFVNPQPGVRRVAVVMCLFQKWVIQSCDTQYIHFHDIFTNAPFYSTRITTFPTCFWLAKYSYASFAWSKLNTLSTIGVIFLALISRFISSNLDAIQYPKRSCGFEESTHCEREPIKMERNITALWSISPVIPFKSSPWSWYYVWIE